MLRFLKNIRTILFRDSIVKSLTVFALICSTSISFAQTKKQFLKSGNTSFEQREYDDAIYYFEQALLFDSKNEEANYKIGYSYYELKDYKDALKFLKKAQRSDDFPLVNFYIGLSSKSDGNYTTAINYFKKFTADYRESDFFFRKATQEIASCYWAIDNELQDATVIDQLSKPINTDYSDFGATFFEDDVIQVSRFRQIPSDKDPNYQASIYTYNEKGERWETSSDDAIKFLSSDTFQIANGFYVAQNKMFYFTKCEENEGDLRCAIFVSQKSANSWSVPEKLNINDSLSTNTQPMIALDEYGKSTLYFASDRRGGQGGLDIWKAKFINFAHFDTPTNLGESINSEGNESTPYFDTKNQVLSFSSDWHYGYGGDDVFVSKMNENSFDKPKNMGQPINTSANDQYYYLQGDESGFLSSNRKGSLQLKGASCCYDVYSFDRTDCNIKDTIIPPIPDDDVEIPLTSLDEKLPVTVYFHNDEPNPKTYSTVTQLSYSDCYEDYVAVKSDYYETFANHKDLDLFFEQKVNQGWKNLDVFATQLLEELQTQKIKLTIEGYCSPLAMDDYNIQLANRRIVSLENYLLEWNQEALRPYFNQGYLQFENAPFGEETAATDVSDDYNDLKSSVFNPKAALERRVAIIAVAIEE